MKVYVLFGDEWFGGVFSTKEKAMEQIKVYKADWKLCDEDWDAMEWEITEHYLDAGV